VRAAVEAGWEAVDLALVTIRPRAFADTDLAGMSFDWICLTSANALPYLVSAREAIANLRTTPCAVVGQRTADRARAFGFEVALDPAVDAAALARTLAAAAGAGAGTKVLWPRGSRSDDLSRELRGAGFVVHDPIAYESEDAAPMAPPPETEAVFFASPSAVHAWREHAAEVPRRIAIAIGPTTFDALLGETEARFFDTISLPEPTPEALGFVLAHLDLETSP
jgi:uroporphyrinogen-III synthase